MNIYDLINKKKKKQKAKAVKTAALTAAIGVTAGAAAGVLLAPKSGKETREDIVNKSVEAKDKLVEKTKAAISTKVSEGKKDVSAAKEKIAEYLASKKGEVLELGNTVEELSDANVETEVKIEEEITAEV